MNSQDKKILRQIDSLGKRTKMMMTMDPMLRHTAYIKTAFGMDGISSEDYTLRENWYELLEQIIKERKEQYANRSYDNLRKNNTSISNSVTTGDRDTCTTGALEYEVRTSETAERADTSEASRTVEFNPQYPDQRAVLLTQESHGCNQLGTAAKLFDNIWQHKIKCQQLIAQAGAGKTFVLGSVIKNLVENGFANDCPSPWPILYVTKASVVEQTKTVLSTLFNLDLFGTVQVINIEQLRSSLVGTLIEKDLDIVEGEEHEKYIWRDGFQPVLIVWDESQGLARAESTQSKIANALVTSPRNRVIYDTYQIDASATPWSRVSEAKHFAISSEKIIELAGGRVLVTPENWNHIAREIADPSDPTEHCTAAIKRFVDVFEDRIVRISNIRPKHKSINSVLKIDFPNQALRDEYYKAVESFEKKSAKISADDTLSESQKYFAVLAEYTIFRKAAENCRREFLAEWIVNTWSEGFAPGVGFSFKQTGSSVCRLLIDHYKWNRSDISIIWGGATEALNTKKKIARKLRDKTDMLKLLAEADISLEDDLGIYLDELQEKTAEQLEFERVNRLLSQKPAEREQERMMFQMQQSKVAMFSYKSGGVGLSLHHEPMYDMARPRKGMFTPVYSEKELVQALGRFPRITSASDTEQTMCYYANTIEEQVAAKVIKKLKCLKEAIRGHESWEDLIIKLPKRSLAKYEKHMMAVDAIEEINTEADEVDMLSTYKE